MSLRASVSTTGNIVRYIPTVTLLLCVIFMQMLVNLGSMTHVLDQIYRSFLSNVYRVYSDLIAAPPSVCHPISPVATGSPPPLLGARRVRRAAAGGAGAGAASVFSQLPLSRLASSPLKLPSPAKHNSFNNESQNSESKYHCNGDFWGDIETSLFES